MPNSKRPKLPLPTKTNPQMAPQDLMIQSLIIFIYLYIHISTFSSTNATNQGANFPYKQTLTPIEQPLNYLSVSQGKKKKMSPTQFHDHHAKKDITTNNNALCPPLLKINKDSHFIKKTSLPMSSSSSSASSLGMAGPARPQQHRQPVIIYTHSPKIIHTHPKDFMALVQKLTGLSRSSEGDTSPIKAENGNALSEEENKNAEIVGNDDNESSSVITDENCGSLGEGQVNSCFVPPIFEPPNPYLTNIPVFTPNSADFLCSNQPFYNYTDSLFFTPNMRSSFPSSSTLEGMNEFREY